MQLAKEYFDHKEQAPLRQQLTVQIQKTYTRSTYGGGKRRKTEPKRAP
jgi:hypothetical protein